MNGEKYDGGKPMAGLMVKDFSLSLLEVAKISTYGCEKYGSPSGWKSVKDAPERYHNALVRHLLQNGIELVDQESNLLHLAHAAWNALAILELYLTQKNVLDLP